MDKVIYLQVHYTVFSLRILEAGVMCNVTAEYSEKASCLYKRIVAGYQSLAGDFCIVNEQFFNL